MFHYVYFKTISYRQIKKLIFNVLSTHSKLFATHRLRNTGLYRHEIRSLIINRVVLRPPIKFLETGYRKLLDRCTPTVFPQENNAYTSVGGSWPTICVLFGFYRLHRIPRYWGGEGGRYRTTRFSRTFF